MNEVSFTVYLLATFVVAFACTGVLVLMFMISDYIATRRDRKKRKSVWNFGDKE
tara:strand:- start:2134 stop:2295 length:162 start_codon:yes stop_codon:yes gene_type:complete